MILNGLPWKGTEIIMWFLILDPNKGEGTRPHPSTENWIKDAFVDSFGYEGYSIFSKGFLTTIVDIMVI